MRKILLIVLFLILGISLVLAAQNGSVGKANNSLNKNAIDGKNQTDIERNQTRLRNETNQTNQGIGQQLSQMIRERKEELKAGDYNGSLGQLLRVRELAQNLRELRVNDIPAKTDLNITAETDVEGKTKLKAVLKNGQEKEIKIMPDTASKRALERLKLKVCSTENNCTIQLKDVGSGETEKIQYEVQIERHSRILGIFQKKMQVSADIDAETGVAKLHKPWWAFIATEPAAE